MILGVIPRRPQRNDLVKLLHSLSGGIVKLLERRGLLIADEAHPSLDLEMGSALPQLQAASVNYRIAIGLQAGRKALTLYSVPPLKEDSVPGLVAQIGGFSLHAGTVCEAYQRSRLERLCRYITRPPVALRRLATDARGRVVYRYRQPFRDGSTQVVLEPLDFMFRMNGMPRSTGSS
ncbi:MAG: transposase [Xanthomonadales bacterium]|nr:transposase [Xanthomonadales bacterium]